MSIASLRIVQEQLTRDVRRHENKAQDELARAAAVRRQLLQVGHKIMLARKSMRRP